MKTLCPGCNAELDPETTLCPICLRQRNPKEIARGLEDQNPALRLRKALARPSTHKMLVGSALLLVAVYILTTRKPPPPAAPEPEHASTPHNPEPAVSTQEIQALRTSLEEAQARKAKRRRDPPRWTIQGRVYTLMSLKPVAGAQIVFQDKQSGRKFKARSDAQGLYTTRLPRLERGGYAVIVRHKYYRGTYLEEDSPPYSDQSRRRREEALHAARFSTVLHVPILLSGNESRRDYNIILLGN